MNHFALNGNGNFDQKNLIFIENSSVPILESQMQNYSHISSMIETNLKKEIKQKEKFKNDIMNFKRKQGTFIIIESNLSNSDTIIILLPKENYLSMENYKYT